MKNFDTQLDRYADLLAGYALNIQEGQCVNLGGEIIHRDLLSRIAKAAYRRGAKYVNIDISDPLHTRQRLELSASDNYLSYVPSYIPTKYNELVENHGAVLRLVGSEEPDCLANLPPEKVNKMQLATRQSLKEYYQEGVGKSKVHWTVAAAATPKWAKKVYPELSENEGCKKLWEDIFKICRLDEDDYIAAWKKHDKRLYERAKKLTDLKIETLHFTGPETDLKVYLSPKAVFRGGSDPGPRGVPFSPNIPTEECFTTPDYKRTEGKVRVTRPFFINGTLIEGLHLTFKNGKIVDFHASKGGDTFYAYINSDAGACQLGEVALVGIDSPIYQSGRVFQEILFDENAACHIAVGFAYRFCLDGGEKMSDEELEAIGCNTSNVHTDMMISSEDVDLEGITYQNKVVPLIKKGAWVY